MATNNSSNEQFANNSDGFGLGGGTTARTLTVTGGNPTITASGSNVMTMPGTSTTLAGLGVAQTFTATQTFATVDANTVIEANNAVTVTSNAGTCSVSFGLNTFTNSSAATMTITIATASATDGQNMIVRIYDFSGVAESITWVNTENSSVIAPATSNGSTTLPLTVGFIYNGSTSKWRCVAIA